MTERRDEASCESFECFEPLGVVMFRVVKRLEKVQKRGDVIIQHATPTALHTGGEKTKRDLK